MTEIMESNGWKAGTGGGKKFALYLLGWTGWGMYELSLVLSLVEVWNVGHPSVDTYRRKRNC